MIYTDFDAIPRGRYGVIYADPPWDHKTWSEKGQGRSPSQHYRIEAFEELCARPVADLAMERCALILWVIRSHLDPYATTLLRAWNFTFKSTAFVWAKTCPKTTSKFFMGMGRSGTRSFTEQSWLASRHPMKVARRLNADVPELIVAPVREHSRKPDEAYGMIERLYAGPYLELFARNERRGWDSWGDEVDLFPPRV